MELTWRLTWIISTCSPSSLPFSSSYLLIPLPPSPLLARTCHPLLSPPCLPLVSSCPLLPNTRLWNKRTRVSRPRRSWGYPPLGTPRRKGESKGETQRPHVTVCFKGDSHCIMKSIMNELQDSAVKVISRTFVSCDGRAAGFSSLHLRYRLHYYFLLLLFVIY